MMSLKFSLRCKEVDVTWQLANTPFNSRLLVGTALYPSPHIMQQAVNASGTQIVTASLRRQSPQEKSGQSFWNFLKELNCHILPNTAGCRTAKEAITLANMAREIFQTNWIKLEVIGDDYNLQPHPFELVIAAKELIQQGFIVFPYCTDDFILCQTLFELGCDILMPWASPIGSGQGLLNIYALKTLRKRLPQATLIIDAGIGAPSDAAYAMELGFDGVLLNSAIALAENPVQMALAFARAVEAGRLGYEAGLMPAREFASPSTPIIGTPFWHQEKTHTTVIPENPKDLSGIQSDV